MNKVSDTCNSVLFLFFKFMWSLILCVFFSGFVVQDTKQKYFYIFIYVCKKNKAIYSKCINFHLLFSDFLQQLDWVDAITDARLGANLDVN